MMTEVVAALIWEGERFLICQRPAHKARGLLWEFVGGKVEPGETPEPVSYTLLDVYKRQAFWSPTSSSASCWSSRRAPRWRPPCPGSGGSGNRRFELSNRGRRCAHRLPRFCPLRFLTLC